MADVLVEHIGWHHDANETQFFDRAASLGDCGVHVLQRHQGDALEPGGIDGTEIGEPVVVGAGEIHRQIHFPRRAEGDAACRIDHLDIDAISVHILDVGHEDLR